MNSLFKKLISGSIVLAISSFISRLIGVYRDHLLANKFGTSIELDAYFAAFRIPDLIYALFIFATISVAFLPLYVKKEKEMGPKETNLFTSKVLNLVIIFTGTLAGLIAIFAPYFIGFYTSGFDQEAQNLTLDLMRIMLLSPIFFAISSIAITVHNASHKFLTQGLAPIFYNLGIIGSIFLSDEFGIKAIAYGVVFGAIMHCLIQFPPLFKNGFKWSLNFSFDKEIWGMIKTAFPRMMAVSVYQASITIDTLIAASLAAGSVTVLNLAANIASLPLGMVIVSIAITTFTYLSKQTGDIKKFLGTIKENMIKTIYWAFPALFGLYAVSEPLIKFLFLSGEFTLDDVFLTQKVLLFLLIAIGFQSFIPILNRAYFAIGDTKKPFLISLISMTLNIIASLILSKFYGVAGIAMGSILGMLVYSILLLFYTTKDFGKFIPFKEILYSLFSGALMFIGICFLGKFVENYNNLIQLIILIPFGIFIYLGVNGFRIRK